MAFDEDTITAIEELIETRITGGAVKSLSIQGKRIENEPLSELFKLLSSVTFAVHGATSTTTKADLRYTGR